MNKEDDEARYYRILGTEVKIGPGKISDNWSPVGWAIYTVLVIGMMIMVFLMSFGR